MSTVEQREASESTASLEGRVAVVTGAGSGIGHAIAIELARRGSTVWCADLDIQGARSTAEAIGGAATPEHVDVTQRESVSRLCETVFARDQRVDVVVSNAGVSTMNRFLDLTDDEWNFNFSVNATGAFLVVQTFARRMLDQPQIVGSTLRGKIIVTASMASRVAAPLLVHYSASKFAAVGLVQGAAKELGPFGITVNGVNPGFVRTSMQEREVAWEAELRGMRPPDVREEYVANTPLHRLQEPEDVAKVVAFLASADADFLTGEVIEANGGAATI